MTCPYHRRTALEIQGPIPESDLAGLSLASTAAGLRPFGLRQLLLTEGVLGRRDVARARPRIGSVRIKSRLFVSIADIIGAARLGGAL